MDVDLAEKLFVCIIMIVTAVGVRFCCRRMGPSGSWASLFIFPLLFHWPLIMGFMNYSFALGLMLLCFGFWLRAETDSLWWWLAFALTVPLLTLSHPVPLLMLLLLCGYDFLTARIFGGENNPLQRRAPMPQMLALGYLMCALAYPLLYSDPSRSSREVKHSMLRLHTYVNELLLYGVSPFYRHAAIASPINLYRLMLFVLLGGAVALGARGLRTRWREHAPTRSDFMLVGAVLLFIIIPLMPDSINGALDFFIRMLLLVWVLSLFAASQCTLGPLGRRTATLAAVLFTAIALLPAELYARPAARQLAVIAHLTLPAHEHGLILFLRDSLQNSLQDSHQDEGQFNPAMTRKLAANPYLWSSMVPLLHAHDVLINSPWLDATYLALAPGSDPKLLYNIVATESEREDIDQHDGDLTHILPSERQRTLAAADFICSPYQSQASRSVEPAWPAGERLWL